MNEILYRTFSLFRRKHNGNSPYGLNNKKSIPRFQEPESYIFLVKDDELLTADTEKVINFSRHLTFGMDHKSFIKRLGKPNHRVHQSEPVDRWILYFKLIMGGHRARCEFHFYKDRLFFYCYNFPYLTEDGKKEILDILHEKYLDHEVDLKSHKIADRNNNIIFIDDMVGLTLNYVALNSDIFPDLETIKAASDTMTQKKKVFYNKELFSML